MSPLLPPQMPPGMPTGDPLEGVATNQSRIIGGSVMAIFLAFFATFARIVFRKTSSVPIKWDDYWIIIASIISIANATCFLVDLNFGFGYHIYTVQPNELLTFFKIEFTTFYLYGASITSIKMSILVFYRRIFAVNLKKLLYTFELLSIIWFTTFVLITTLQCLPISKNWDASVQGACLDYLDVYIALQVWNICLDIGILVLPISAVMKLQLPKSRKISVAATFLLGGISIVFAIIRLVVLTELRAQTDITYGTSTAIWSLVEPAFQIFCVSLPCYTPVLKANKWISSWSNDGKRLLSIFKRRSNSRSSNSGNGDKSLGTSGVECGHFRQVYVTGKTVSNDDRRILIPPIELAVYGERNSGSNH